MAPSPSFSPLGSSQFDSSYPLPLLQYLGLCYLNHRYGAAKLPRENSLLATVRITTYQGPDRRLYTQIIAEDALDDRGNPVVDEGTGLNVRQTEFNDEDYKFLYKQQDGIWVSMPSGEIQGNWTRVQSHRLFFHSDEESVFYVVNERDGTVVQLLTNHGAFALMEKVLGRQNDLLRKSERPQEKLIPWSTVYFQYFYSTRNEHFHSKRNGPYFDKISRHRYVKISVVHDDDQKIRGVYEEDMDTGEWSFLPTGLPDEYLRHGPRQIWKLHARKSRAGYYYIEDVQNNQYYDFLYNPTTQESHCCAHMAGFSGTQKESSWVWHRIEFDTSVSSHETLGLLVCRDKEHVIEDRVIVKALKRQPLLAEEELVSETDLLVEPNELFLHRKLQELHPKSPYFIKLRTHSYHFTESTYPHKLYIEYAPYKTLNQVIVDHVEVHEESDTPKHLPEMFIWYVFSQLVEGCSLLSFDGLDGEKYVHADIKPSNVLMVDSQPDASAYPTPVLADFGFYYHLNRDAINFAMGTYGFQAPEQCGPFPHTPVRVDVFTIGLTIWCLTRNCSEGLQHLMDTDPNNLETMYADLADRLSLHDTTSDYDGLYSTGLEDLISHCLEANLVNRPTMEDLRTKVRARSKAWNESHDNIIGMEADNLARWDRVLYLEDEFSVGSVLPRSTREDS
ncbi:kinase-like protein [Melanomma pulvis-pyrius CBS 109.77]|uniref:non-specific serine/threonine protein kinase n=1 Tax=Melanomma pulvis-pyrius CBS 109.77 TaxID=1314802 RepID=A0A6A6WVB3_9PLEO|nr:kinase-like protein [Melanomma pulvis-pyrius CBS 109.77]